MLRVQNDQNDIYSNFEQYMHGDMLHIVIETTLHILKMIINIDILPPYRHNDGLMIFYMRKCETTEVRYRINREYAKYVK